MNLRDVSRLLQWIIVGATILTALCPLYFATFMMRLYQQNHQPMSSVWSIGSGGLLISALYLVAAILYVRVRTLRPLLQLLAVVMACVAVGQAFGYWSFVQERNMLNNILAEPIWEMFGRVFIACACIAHFVVEQLCRRQNVAIAS